MSDTTKVNNWSFPFKPREGKLDPIQHLTAMAKAGGGYYPIGKNGQWHGGIHFDDKTAAVFDQSQVCCIADGEVIAYRIDRNYPKNLYLNSSKNIFSAAFSRCFVLVKHRLEVPELPAREGITPIPPPSLTFFSLYMHLLDWDSYSKTGAPTAPAFIGETLYKVKPNKATDSVRGLRVRETPPPGQVVAILPKGSKAKLGEAHSLHEKWRKLLAVVGGQALPANAAIDGWVFTGEMEPTSDVDVFLVGERANDLEPTLAPEKGLNVRKTGNGRSNDPTMGILPVGAIFSLESSTGAYRKLKEIVSGQDTAPLSSNSAHNIQGFVHIDSLDTTRSEPVLNEVHLLPTPYPIKAGELIGHLGQYQNQDDGSPKRLLHLEVFSCEDVPDFIARSRIWAVNLPDQQKTLLKVYKGASKLILHREDIKATNPPKTSDAGTTIGVDLIIPQSLLDSLPADHKLQVSTTLPGSTTPIVTRWWRLNNLLADSSGNPISGWLAEQEPITTRHSPWEWVGYDFIKETGRPLGKAAYFYDALRRLTDKEKANYRVLLSQEDQGPVKTRLYDIIDTNRDNKLTAAEIRSALAKPWHAQSIAQLITHYESEWLWKADKWDELDPLMGHVPYIDPNLNWESEKTRIERLSWWKSLAGKQGISSDRNAWHFHGINFVANFSKGKKINITTEMLKKIFEGLTSTSKSDELLNEIASQINENCERYKLDTTLRLSHFFAQVRQEIGSECRIFEDFTYSPEGLKKTFRYFKSHPSEAIIYGYSGNSKFVSTENQIAIANRAYASRYDNGDIASGDGWRYRGRGLKHLTFRSNYTAFKRYHKNFWNEDVDFVQNPDLLHENYKYSVRSGIYFWLSNNLFAEADKGATDSGVDAITRIVNEATDSYEKRRYNFKRIFEIENIFKDI